MDSTKRELLPPERLSKELNMAFPNIWAVIKKARENVHTLKPEKETDVKHRACVTDYKLMPDWIHSTTSFVLYTMGKTPAYGDFFLHTQDSFMGVVEAISCIYSWRQNKSVYRFTPELLNALTVQELDPNIHMDVFLQLPYCGIYIETPGMTWNKQGVKGYIANIEESAGIVPKRYMLTISFCMKDNKWKTCCMSAGMSLYSSLKECNITHSANATRRKFTDKEIQAEIKEVAPFLNMLLYLCSKEPDITERQSPMPAYAGNKHNCHTTPPREWDVGVRVAKMLKEHKEKEGVHSVRASGAPTLTARRPHIRRAHWHTYWIGPRDEVFPKRKTILKWLPPIPVNVTDVEKLPVVVQEVG